LVGVVSFMPITGMIGSRGVAGYTAVSPFLRK